jgi:hypothetical protein
MEDFVMRVDTDNCPRYNLSKNLASKGPEYKKIKDYFERNFKN